MTTTDEIQLRAMADILADILSDNRISSVIRYDYVKRITNLVLEQQVAEDL